MRGILRVLKTGGDGGCIAAVVGLAFSMEFEAKMKEMRLKEDDSFVKIFTTHIIIYVVSRVISWFSWYTVLQFSFSSFNKQVASIMILQ